MTDIMIIGARGIPDAEGGAEKHAERLFPLFASAGYDVTLLGINTFIKQDEYKGVRLRGIPTIDVAGTDKLIYHFLALLRAAFTRPKLVHLQGLNSAFFLLAYKLLGMKVVLRYGSADHEYAKWGFVGRTGFRLCERQIRYADHVIAVSQKYKHTLRSRYGLDNISVIPNGLDAPDIPSESAAYLRQLRLDGVRYVLAVGRITVDKDYDTLVEAVQALKDPEVQLIVAGGASEQGYADRFFEHPDPRIRFLGVIDRSLLPALYAGCAAYVNSSRHEGLSNAVLEAVSYGSPVVVSDIPANTEIGLNECSHFATGDPASLTDRLEAALNDPDAFRASADAFSDWADVFHLTEAVYHNVLPELAEVTSGQSAQDGELAHK